MYHNYIFEIILQMCPEGHKNEVNRCATISEKSNLLPNLKAQAVLYLYTKRHLLKLIRTNKEELTHSDKTNSQDYIYWYILASPTEAPFPCIGLLWLSVATKRSPNTW